MVLGSAKAPWLSQEISQVPETNVEPSTQPFVVASIVACPCSVISQSSTAASPNRNKNMMLQAMRPMKGLKPQDLLWLNVARACYAVH